MTLRPGLAVVERHLELFAPRIRNAVLRIDDPPAARVERVLDALHRRLLVADRERNRRARPRARGGLRFDARRGVVDVEADALQLADERGRRGIRRRVRGRDSDEVGAVRNRRRVPHEDRIPDAAVQRPSTRSRPRGGRDVVLQAIVVVVFRLPDERLQALLIDAPAERRRRTERAAGPRLRLRRRRGRRRCSPRTRQSRSRRSRTAAGTPCRPDAR